MVMDTRRCSSWIKSPVQVPDRGSVPGFAPRDCAAIVVADTSMQQAITNHLRVMTFSPL
jgi:hypothetical protein